MSLKARLFYAAVQISFLSTTTIGCMPDLDVPERDEEDELVSPSDPSALSQVLVIPGATRVQGSLPSSTTIPSPTSTSSPSIQGGSSLSVTSGGQVVLELQYESSTGTQYCYVQVRGASDYFRISASQSAASGRIQIPVNLPSSVSSGSFSFNTTIAGSGGLVSNMLSTSVSVSRPSTSPTPSPSPSPSPSPTGATCSGVQTVGSCKMEYCISAGATSCWYRVNSKTFNCSSCQNITPCAQSAATYLTNSCY